MVIIRAFAVGAAGLFIFLAWLLAQKRLFVFAATVLVFATLPNHALASCTTSTMSMGDGKIKLCTTCCNSAGVCDTHCY